jgi:two-component system, OmpR family, response regulator
MEHGAKIKLFLVDDDALYLKLLEIEFLQHTDFVVETYPTGELCIEHLSHSPDVVVLDYHLNGIDPHAMNGIETLDKIKAAHPGIPVVMLSAQDDREEAINCMAHHAIDYVMKGEAAFLRLQHVIATIFVTKKWKKGGVM